MKISNNTITLLKFFSGINGSIKIDPGNKLYTKSEAGSMCAYCEVDETFDTQFITSNLSRFLSVIDMFDDPDFEINDSYVNITSANGKNKTIFYQSNPALVNQSNRIPAPQADIAISFKLTSDDLKKIFKAFSVLGVSDLMFKAKDGLITAIVYNSAVKTTDTYEIVIGECDPDIDLSFSYKKNNLKLLTDFNYDVEVSSKGLSVFKATNSPFNAFVVYVITTFVNE